LLNETEQQHTVSFPAVINLENNEKDKELDSIHVEHVDKSTASYHVTLENISDEIVCDDEFETLLEPVLQPMNNEHSETFMAHDKGVAQAEPVVMEIEINSSVIDKVVEEDGFITVTKTALEVRYQTVCMKIFYWNIRGIGNSESRITLKNLYDTHKPSLIFIAEPMISFENVPHLFWWSINIRKFCLNDCLPRIPSMWALWGNDLDATIIFVSDQCVALEIVCHGKNIYVAAIYAHNLYMEHCRLWAHLKNVQGCFHRPWLFVGVFNAVLGAHEKRGRRSPNLTSCNDFLGWGNVNLLTHLNTQGVFYTWYNGRLGFGSVPLRLDRAICNDMWLDFWRNVSCCSLVIKSLGSSSVLVSQEFSLVSHATPFKIFKSWIIHNDCKRLVKEIWVKLVVGMGIVCLKQKLKRIKTTFRVWKKSVFGDIDRQVKLSIDEMNHLQHLTDIEGPSDTLLDE